jgi:hypothetical protein
MAAAARPRGDEHRAECVVAVLPHWQFHGVSAGRPAVLASAQPGLRRVVREPVRPPRAEELKRHGRHVRIIGRLPVDRHLMAGAQLRVVGQRVESLDAHGG